MSTTLPLARLAPLALGLATLGLAPFAYAQQFTRDTTNVPLQGGTNCENVDFGDLDLDGDWDCAFANGGDNFSLQNAIWINQGFAQSGTLGAYLDATAARAPAVLDQSRDIEFVDFDADGDLDVYVSNTAQLTVQGNRWWANMGGLQAGSTGFFQDQTSTRWSGLGLPGSSIAISQVIAGNTFIDFSCDCDFGDIDNDGDLDLFHSSYGSSLSATVPTRLFFNNGSGVFSEFNPSGFQLPNQTIATGNPGLWCEGTQLNNTVDGTGVTCDIAASPLGIEIGDIDGDLDLDIVHGARSELPRLFINRLPQSGRFRDVTGTQYPPGYSTGTGHYEQELGDFDGDGDLDIYGMNWLSLTDDTLTNSGNGVYTSVVSVPGSGADDNESDFFDSDLDGDLDVFIANFSGNERLYINDGVGGLTLSVGVIPATSGTSLDADCCDFDSDGDYDVIIANDNNQEEWVLVNGTTSNDVTAPTLAHLEQAPDRTPGAAPTVVRVHVYDNAPYYITWYNPSWLEVQVNGGAVTQYPLKSVMGQLFRGEIPGNLAGTISYRAVSADEYGNTGQSVIKSYVSGLPGNSICSNATLGVDHSTACPCGNVGAADNGCGHSFSAAGANLAASGSIAGDSVLLTATALPGTSFTLFMQHDAAGDQTFHDGVLCAGGGLIRLRGRGAVGGVATFPNSTFPQDATLTLSQRGSVTVGSGAVRYYAGWYRNASTTFCPPATANVTNGWRVTW